eukprot:g13595.t1
MGNASSCCDGAAGRPSGRATAAGNESIGTHILGMSGDAPIGIARGSAAEAAPRGSAAEAGGVVRNVDVTQSFAPKVGLGNDRGPGASFFVGAAGVDLAGKGYQEGIAVRALDGSLGKLMALFAQLNGSELSMIKRRNAEQNAVKEHGQLEYAGTR